MKANRLYLFLIFSREFSYLPYGRFLLCPRDSLQFHIQENDYFGTLATVLDLIQQDLRKRGHARHADTLVRLRDDLVYLQSSCTIKTGTARDEERWRPGGRPWADRSADRIAVYLIG